VCGWVRLRQRKVECDVVTPEIVGVVLTVSSAGIVIVAIAEIVRGVVRRQPVHGLGWLLWPAVVFFAAGLCLLVTSGTGGRL